MHTEHQGSGSRRHQVVPASSRGRDGCRLKAFRTYCGGEFTSIEFAEYCVERGVRRQLMASYSPQQNGVVECRNQTVVGTTRSLLKSKGLPGWLWGEAVATAVYLLNRSPTRGVEGKTSFEGWYGKKPGVQHLRTFGCLVHVKDTSPNLKKLNDRSRSMIFIGYEPGSKAYRAYNPVSKKVHVSRDIVFDEQASWNCSDGGEHGEQVNNDMFTVEMEYSTVIQGVPDAGAEAGAPAMMSPDGSPESLSRSPSPVQIGADGNGDQMVEPITPHGVRDEDLDANHDEDMPLRLRAIEDILGPAPPQGLARRVLA
jgi:hypothetical protein